MLWKHAVIKKVEYTFPSGCATLVLGKGKVIIEANCHGLGAFVQCLDSSGDDDLNNLVGKDFYYVEDKYNILQYFTPPNEWEGPEIKLGEELEYDPPSAVDDFLETMHEMNPEALYPTDMKEAIIGYVERAGMQPQVLLDRNKCIHILVDQGMTEEEALEYFEFNTIGAFMGKEGTPLFATLIGNDDSI